MLKTIADMRIWIPYIDGGSGSDRSTLEVADGFRRAGDEIVLQRFARNYQFAPWLLRRVPAPRGSSIVLTNNWNGFAFARPGICLVTVDRYFPNDHSLSKYKGLLQQLYHQHLIRRYIIASARCADRVVAVSQYTAAAYAQALDLPKPLVILNAVDTEFYTPDVVGKPPLANRPFKLLFVGNLSMRKGADLLAPIMQRLGAGFELTYTSGIRKSRLKQSAPNMIPLVTQNAERMRESYRQADMLLFPSRGEGLSRALMESLACGTPVVAADASSNGEAVDDSVGALCPVDDVDAFAAAIVRLSKRPQALRQMGRSARVRAIQRFALTRLVTEYRQLFEELVACQSHRLH